jgi:hypothetical protein
MNARSQVNLKEMFATFHRDIDALPPVVIRVTPRELKHAIIDCDPLSHRDLVDVLMGLAAKVKKGVGSALGDECARSVASHLADIADVIEADLASQQAEAAWSERS